MLCYFQNDSFQSIVRKLIIVSSVECMNKISINLFCYCFYFFILEGRRLYCNCNFSTLRNVMPMAQSRFYVTKMRHGTEIKTVFQVPQRPPPPQDEARPPHGEVDLQREVLLPPLNAAVGSDITG